MIQDMKNGGTIIFNGDDDILRESGPIKGVEPVFFGTGDNSDFRATDIKPLGLKGTSCTLHMPNGTSFDCVVPLPGIHMVSNALAGAAVGYSLDLTNEEIKAGIENLPSIPGRNHIIITDKLTILDDCYNANRASVDGTEVHWFETKADFLAEMKNIMKEGDNVLVKASHGMHFPELVEALEAL